MSKKTILFRIFNMKLYLYWQLYKIQKHAYLYLGKDTLTNTMNFKQQSHKLINSSERFHHSTNVVCLINIIMGIEQRKDYPPSPHPPLCSELFRLYLEVCTQILQHILRRTLVNLIMTRMKKNLDILLYEKPLQKLNMLSLEKTR